ncbi:MAG: plastocyanin/azurin family copper-binding protein, partial [Candidatus Bipolaricaulota bacterium]|nr:plastocyanin/azurin family copper-binding protein [Candidatus Bipolaricaulota bacterium]
MERWLALLAGIVAVLLGALWFWLRGSPPSTADVTSQPRVFVVEIRDFYFDPPGLTLRPGDRIIWILKENANGDGHTVTAYHPSQDRPLRIPSEAAPWNSQLMTTLGQTFTQSFSVPGIYDYFCVPHEQQGMVGRIIVGEGIALTPDERGLPAAALSAIPTTAELQSAVGEAFNAIGLLQGVLYLAQQGQSAS